MINFQKKHLPCVADLSEIKFGILLTVNDYLSTKDFVHVAAAHQIWFTGQDGVEIKSAGILPTPKIANAVSKFFVEKVKGVHKKSPTTGASIVEGKNVYERIKKISSVQHMIGPQSEHFTPYLIALYEFDFYEYLQDYVDLLNGGPTQEDFTNENSG